MRIFQKWQDKSPLIVGCQDLPSIINNEFGMYTYRKTGQPQRQSNHRVSEVDCREMWKFPGDVPMLTWVQFADRVGLGYEELRAKLTATTGLEIVGHELGSPFHPWGLSMAPQVDVWERKGSCVSHCQSSGLPDALVPAKLLCQRAERKAATGQALASGWVRGELWDLTKEK